MTKAQIEEHARFMRENANRQRQRRPAITGIADEIIRRAAESWGCSTAEIVEDGAYRPKLHVTRARTQAAHELLGMGLQVTTVARCLGKHHTTILHYRKRGLRHRVPSTEIDLTVVDEWV